ncbi:hypothetical protein [Corynebacterium lubricantis]|uniref:hypothetical protein n=1 Tax=Corynebacterium lubricantis TaxID=541095 RepID=UPI000377075B|nr:hypothetical protein [Corynebacterium lubricantis]
MAAQLSPENRKVIYSVSGSLLSLLVVFNVITADSIAQWQDAIMLLAETAVPFVGALGNFYAVAKTKHGSDDPVTQDDVERAKAQGRSEVEQEIALQTPAVEEVELVEVPPVPQVPAAYDPSFQLESYNSSEPGKHARLAPEVDLPTFQKPGV